MNPEVWGPPAWTFLHSITINYPHNPTPEEKIHYFNFFDNLKNVLPCEICKKHYKSHLEAVPLSENIDSKDKLIRWLINIHNKINVMNGKKEWTYQEVIDHYDNLHINSASKLNKNIGGKIVFLLLALAICVYYIYSQKRKGK